MKKKVFKIKNKHFRKTFSYGEFYKKLGLLKYFKKNKHHNFYIGEVHTNQKTYTKIYEGIAKFYEKYRVLASSNYKIVKKDKNELGMTKYEKRTLAMDGLNIAPFVDNDVPDNEIWVLWEEKNE